MPGQDPRAHRRGPGQRPLAARPAQDQGSRTARRIPQLPQVVQHRRRQTLRVVEEQHTRLGQRLRQRLVGRSGTVGQGPRRQPQRLAQRGPHLRQPGPDPHHRPPHRHPAGQQMQSLLDRDRLPQPRIPVHAADPPRGDRVPHRLHHLGHLPRGHQPRPRRIQPHPTRHPGTRSSLHHAGPLFTIRTGRLAVRAVHDRRAVRTIGEAEFGQCPVVPARFHPARRGAGDVKHPARPQPVLDRTVQRRQGRHKFRLPAFQRALVLRPEHPAAQLGDVPAHLGEDLPQRVAHREPALPRPSLHLPLTPLGQPPPHRPLRHPRQTGRDPHMQRRQTPLTPVHRQQPPHHHRPLHPPGHRQNSRTRHRLPHRGSRTRHKANPTASAAPPHEDRKTQHSRTAIC